MAPCIRKAYRLITHFNHSLHHLRFMKSRYRLNEPVCFLNLISSETIVLQTIRHIEVRSPDNPVVPGNLVEYLLVDLYIWSLAFNHQEWLSCAVVCNEIGTVLFALKLKAFLYGEQPWRIAFIEHQVGDDMLTNPLFRQQGNPLFPYRVEHKAFFRLVLDDYSLAALFVCREVERVHRHKKSSMIEEFSELSGCANVFLESLCPVTNTC